MTIVIPMWVIYAVAGTLGIAILILAAMGALLMWSLRNFHL